MIFRCDVDTGDGLICGTEFRAYDVTVEEYQAAREWKGKRITVIKNGEAAGGGGLLTIPGIYRHTGGYGKRLPCKTFHGGFAFR